MTTRREVLQGLTWAGLSALVGPGAWAATGPIAVPVLKRHGNPQHVIIVGAGLAGLASAYLLKQAGHRVTVLEARLRPGGRITTVREPFAEGLVGELGPARIPETHTRIRAWVAHHGLELEPFDPRLDGGDRLDVVQGKKIRYKYGSPPGPDAYPWAFTAAERKMGFDAIGKRWSAPFEKFPVDLLGKDWPPKGLRRYDAITTRQYTISIGLSEAVDKYYGLGFEDPGGANFSALWIYRLNMLAPFDRPLSRIRGGLDLLPKAFAKHLHADIRYGVPLVGMTQDGKGVGAVIDTNGGRETVRGDRAIVTAPFPALRKVDFNPALSQGKQRSIRQMQYENLARVLLQLNARPWEKDGLAGWAKTDLPSEVWHLSYGTPGPRALYGVYLKGTQAERLKEMNEKQRIDHAAKHVDSIFPGVAAAVEGGLSKVWSEDPWTGGAHAGLAPGQVTALMPYAVTAEGRIHFAGEHTSAWQAWMEGGLESGERAAREVNDAA